MPLRTALGADGRVAITPGVVDVVVMQRVPIRGRERANAGAGHAWRVLVLQRGANTRCPGSWEVVHGRIERGERPEHAARREVAEETGLHSERLYAITVNAFYLAGRDVQAALVFAAITQEGLPEPEVVLSHEHVAFRWLSISAAQRVLTWPREIEALTHIAHLLRSGDAGAAEDVLRVPD